jgi:hypothetical protein
MIQRIGKGLLLTLPRSESISLLSPTVEMLGFMAPMGCLGLPHNHMGECRRLATAEDALLVGRVDAN